MSFASPSTVFNFKQSQVNRYFSFNRVIKKCTYPELQTLTKICFRYYLSTAQINGISEKETFEIAENHIKADAAAQRQ